MGRGTSECVFRGNPSTDSGLSVLNYMVTSNHIHLLVRDIGERDVIPNSIQLIAGRTGQEYNQRKNRKGAYWEDRYHATAVETDSHLIPCAPPRVCYSFPGHVAVS